ncbi:MULTISPECIES: TetR/AcrR family transcriptional regulator [unclassified Sphingomonas]|uniref:TetR/AcrR family transcriptional regulator n=1 Tax=unclassified Sphingomonas TaxID=196159 RepID=UPI000E75C4D8|nr:MULTISPECIES: TetR/AcrR family transcriptional regulator [unclassified Sphingomonas]RKE43615.1 TetR family transcriptional regulator [Sphingomonas sp. PP-CC-1A-547]TCM05838.1 TetR family transcriptional regulator [Sphingomonas sp. PP-CC-3G-468]
MARPNSADPDATRERILDAAVILSVHDGFDSLSARSVALASGVSATTVCALFGGMSGLHAKVIETAFVPLLKAFSAIDHKPSMSVFKVATGQLYESATLAGLVTQIAALAGLRHGRHRALADQIDRSLNVVRDHFATVEVPNSPLRGYGDSVVVADRIIAVYFAAAFHLAPDPGTDRDRLRALVGE